MCAPAVHAGNAARSGRRKVKTATPSAAMSFEFDGQLDFEFCRDRVHQVMRCLPSAEFAG